MAADDAADLARSRFVEQFALLLNDGGLQRMPARVFAYMLASDAETHTAAELAEGLRVSPAAISGAVRLLGDIGMVIKDREPGDRVDHYRLYGDDVWATIMGRQEPMFRHTDVMFADGLQMLTPGRPGHRRIHETREFYRFVYSQLATLSAQWREQRAARLAERSAVSPEADVRSEPEPVRAASGE